MDPLRILNSCISSEMRCVVFRSASGTRETRKRSLILFSYHSNGFEALVLTLPHISGSCQLEEQGLAPRSKLWPLARVAAQCQ